MSGQVTGAETAGNQQGDLRRGRTALWRSYPNGFMAWRRANVASLVFFMICHALAKRVLTRARLRQYSPAALGRAECRVLGRL